MHPLLNDVLAHARKHYGDGWDIFVESYSKKELSDLLGEKKVKNLKDAIATLQKIVDDSEDKRSDIEGSRF